MGHPQNSSRQSKWAGLSRKPARDALLCLAILILGSLAAEPAGQQQNPNHLSQLPRSPYDGFGSSDPLLAARQMRAMNAERQKSLETDTAKLLKIAQELNSEIETGNKDGLTQVELRKIADIEKLARNVKQKMSISFGDGQLFDQAVPRQNQ
jgi:hypothetical protein